MPRRSGRYPYGSGDHPYQSVKDALKGKQRSDYFTSERTIPKGTKVFRTSTNNQENSNGPIYVTYLDPDRDLYKGGYIKDRDKKEKSYEYQMEIKKDLKIPSRDEYKQAINEVIEKKPKLLKESVEAYLDEFIPENTWDRWQIMSDPNTGKIDTSLWDKYVNDSYKIRKDTPVIEQWGSIAMSLGKANSLKDAIINNLSKKGYNAMVDEAGVGGDGRAVEGIDSLIIFDSKAISIDNVVEISKKEEKKSQKNYNKWVGKSRYNNSKYNTW